MSKSTSDLYSLATVYSSLKKVGQNEDKKTAYVYSKEEDCLTLIQRILLLLGERESLNVMH
jgi:hypothetical protein